MTLRQAIATVSCWLLASIASAAQFIDHEGYRIHYATFSSMIIPGEVAALHNIPRSENRIVLNLSVVQDEMPSAARVTGHVVNLLNQRYELSFDEVREADAIYYLASHTALEQDILRFELQVVPGDATEALTFRFLRRYD